jgi:hypothetical protein
VVNARRRNRPTQRASRLLEAARKFAREVDKTLGDVRGDITPEVPAEILDVIIDQHYPHIRELEAAKCAAEAVIVRCEGSRPRNPARSIKDALLDAWHQAGVQAGKGVNPEDLLCREVTELLKLAGLHYEASSVSEMLRKRENRARSGGGRKLAEKVPA